MYKRILVPVDGSDTSMRGLGEGFGGSAADPIAAQAKKWNADLIVMGTHGRRGLRRLAMGSDAALVVRESSAPVLLVRHVAKLEAGGKAPDAASSAT